MTIIAWTTGKRYNRTKWYVPGAKETAGVTCTGAFSGDSLGGGAKAPLSILIGGGAKGCEKDEFGLLGDKNGTSSVVFGGGEADKGGDASGGCDIDPD